MGSCIGLHRQNNSSSVDNSVRKNYPLCRERINWKSDNPLTDGQLRSKRDEFWDTAPAFDGRKEIWDALRAASHAIECDDFELGQAIVDGASITVPNGYLTECYDELGTRYQVPIYCLFEPINIVKNHEFSSPNQHDESIASTSSADVTTYNIDNDSPQSATADTSLGTKTNIKLRLSHTNQDVKLVIFTTDSILICKNKLQISQGIEVSKQRWFFGGKLLMDRMIFETLKIPRNYIIQVVVDTLTPSP